MKKPTPKYLSRIRRLIAYRQNRDAKKRRLLYRKRREREKDNGDKRIIYAPKHFCLLSSEVLPFLNFIERLSRTICKADVGRIHIHFGRTEKMFSDGTLYFLAVLETLKRQYPHKRITMHHPTDPIVSQVLQKVGITRLLNRKDKFHPNDYHKTVKHWCVASGNNVNAQNADDVFAQCEGILTPELNKSIYTGVTEAMTNCMHHAYDENTPSERQKWWLFSREDNNSLQVLFCDLGMGIPKSLYRETEDIANDWWERLKNYFLSININSKHANDGAKIKAAIEIGQTRTQKTNRGLGLKQMVSNLDKLSSNQAEVIIISGSGIYRRRRSVKELVSYLSDKKEAQILGTLIAWNIPLSAQE